MINPEDRLIVALDTNVKNALKLVTQLRTRVSIFKVGPPLFFEGGFEFIKRLIKLGVKVFFDLKFHDIPNTVFNSVSTVISYSPYMMTIHTLGGGQMMKEAVRSADTIASSKKVRRPLLMGVTVLTSINDEILKNDLKIDKRVKHLVEDLACLAKLSGMDGVIASPYEIRNIRERCGDQFIIVTPGIRPDWTVRQDQKRVLTPYEAIKNGADLIVVGRPIVNADNPVDASDKIIEEIYKAS